MSPVLAQQNKPWCLLIQGPLVSFYCMFTFIPHQWTGLIGQSQTQEIFSEQDDSVKKKLPLCHSKFIRTVIVNKWNAPWSKKLTFSCWLWSQASSLKQKTIQNITAREMQHPTNTDLSCSLIKNQNGVFLCIAVNKVTILTES